MTANRLVLPRNLTPTSATVSSIREFNTRTVAG